MAKNNDNTENQKSNEVEDKSPAEKIAELKKESVTYVNSSNGKQEIHLNGKTHVVNNGAKITFEKHLEEIFLGTKQGTWFKEEKVK